jgi:inosine/xanthosine triphosphate pyrophosphatase family protein
MSETHPQPAKILFASTNADKLKRFKVMCEGLPIQIISLHDLGYEIPEPDETGSNERENALIKSRYYYNSLTEKMIVVSQDDGMNLIGVDDVDNPGDHLKRKAAQMYGDSSDENLHKFLSYLTAKYETIEAKLVWSFAVYDGSISRGFEYFWEGNLVNSVSTVLHTNAPIESHLQVKVGDKEVFASELTEADFLVFRSECIAGLRGVLAGII